MWVQWWKVFQPISLHTIFARNFPVWYLCALHFYHFLADFNLLYTIYILILFSTVFQPTNVLVIFFSYTLNITPNFDTIFRIQNDSVTLFFSILIVWLEIVCLHKLWNPLFIVFFAINLCFISWITRFIPFFTLYLAFSSLTFLFSFPSVSPHLPLSSLLISLLRLEIALSIFVFLYGSFLSPLLPFFTTTFLQPRAMLP